MLGKRGGEVGKGTEAKAEGHFGHVVVAGLKHTQSLFKFVLADEPGRGLTSKRL